MQISKNEKGSVKSRRAFNIQSTKTDLNWSNQVHYFFEDFKTSFFWFTSLLIIFDWNFNKKLISLNYWSESSFKMACLFRKTLGAEKKSLILKPNQILDDLKQMLFWGLAKTNFEKVVNSLWFIPLIEGQHNRDLVYFFLKEKSK